MDKTLGYGPRAGSSNLSRVTKKIIMIEFHIKRRWDILAAFFPELYQDIACYCKGDEVLEAFDTFGIPEKYKGYYLMCPNKHLREAMEEVLKENWDDVREKAKSKNDEELKKEGL